MYFRDPAHRAAYDPTGAIFGPFLHKVFLQDEFAAVTPGTAIADDIFTPNLQKNIVAQKRRAYQWLRACGRC